jgi:hypothetical protein
VEVERRVVKQVHPLLLRRPPSQARYAAIDAIDLAATAPFSLSSCYSGRAGEWESDSDRIPPPSWSTRRWRGRSAPSRENRWRCVLQRREEGGEAEGGGEVVWAGGGGGERSNHKEESAATWTCGGRRLAKQGP